MTRVELEFRMDVDLNRADLDMLDRYYQNRRWVKQKEKAFLKMLRTLPQEDQEMFVNLLPSWKQALHEDALAYPIDELCEAIKQALREQNESMTELNRNQKAALRIQVNLLFLEKYGICPDDPWTITY